MEKVKRTSLFGALLAIIKSIGETKNDISEESTDISELKADDYKKAGVTKEEIDQLNQSMRTVNVMGSNLFLNIEKQVRDNKFKGNTNLDNNPRKPTGSKTTKLRKEKEENERSDN